MEHVNLGPECNFFLSLPEDIQISVRKSCLDFFITAADDMQKRSLLNNTFFDCISFLKPKTALRYDRPQNHQPVYTKFSALNDINCDLIALEWKKIFFNLMRMKKYYL